MAKKSDLDREIIRRVQEKRLKEKVSLRTLASVMGTHHSFPAEVEKEDSPCKFSTNHLYYIAQFFDCPISDLYPELDAFPSKLEKPNI